MPPFQNLDLWTGEMAWWLRPWAVLPEDPCLGPSTHIGQVTSACHSSSREFDALFCGFPGHTPT